MIYESKKIYSLIQKLSIEDLRELISLGDGLIDEDETSAEDAVVIGMDLVSMALMHKQTGIAKVMLRKVEMRDDAITVYFIGDESAVLSRIEGNFS
jgi:hypothetical protein